MRVIALTGNIASGKSTVAALLRAHGAPVLDLDAMVHALQRPGESVYAAIVAAFGPAILAPDGTLDRPALRERILAEPAARHTLEAITHPAVRAEEEEELATLAAAGTPLAFVEIPLLFESGDPARYDGVLLVDAPAPLRRERLMATRGLSAETADRMMATQLAPEGKRERADWIIDNDGDAADLARAVEQLWQDLAA